MLAAYFVEVMSVEAGGGAQINRDFYHGLDNIFIPRKPYLHLAGILTALAWPALAFSTLWHFYDSRH